MSATTRSLAAMKASGKKITMLTAYDFPTARILDECEIDIILVGDSLGDNILGYENTLPVTMEDMLHHTKAVARGAKDTMIIADMPFMSFQLGAKEAFLNASRFMKEGGSHGVKIEGTRHIDPIKAIIDAGIPVMGHIGFTPQSVNQLGGYKVQGRSAEGANSIINDAKALEKAGVFSIVLEMVPADLGEKVSRSVGIPVIGCGAGVSCDGQVLVLSDVLGLTCREMPKFAKKYIDLNSEIAKAVSAYASDVRSGKFPGKEQSF